MSGGGGTISTSEPRLGALRVQQSSYGLAIPIVYGRTRVSGNLGWYDDFVAIAHTTTTRSGGKGGGGGGGVTQQNTTYTYEAAILLALCEGPIGGVVSVWQAKKRFKATETQSAIEQLGLSLATGAAGQPTWGHLSVNHPAQALGYSSTAHLHSAAFSLGANAEIDNHSFELDGKLQFGSGIVDANPKDIVYDLLTNPQYGAAFPVASMGDLSVYGAYCQAIGLFLSPAFTEQQEAREHLKLLTSMTNSACVWSEGKLKLVPYGDDAVSGNGATYTPNLTPIYDLTDDDYIVTGAEDPVKCDRKTPADAYNQVQVEYLNRANAYNIEIAEAKDQANIEKFGLRPRDPIKMHAICDATVARRAAQLQLQRSLYVRNEYEFQLSWKYCLLEPMDLVTLTDEGLGLDRTPVRIIDVQEDADGLLTLRAEDYPFGVASATLYPMQSGAGFAADYSASPGNVATPVFFEPPIELATATGLEVWCAVSGQPGSTGKLWGGCHVWASVDGMNYRRVGIVRGGARYGTLTAPLTSGGPSMAVSLAGRGGQMLSGTAQDASLLSTLCWVGTEAGGEYVAHTTATLTAVNAYTLEVGVRGAYTTPVVPHATGQQFVRIDEAICKGDPLDIAMIGQTIFFKFCSFNAYGGGLQQLADVDVHQYTITGSMFKLPPADVTGLALRIEGNGVRVVWDACTDPGYAYTIVRFGDAWSTSTTVSSKASSTHLLSWQPAGVMKVWAAHVDLYGNVSEVPASASLTIHAPAQPVMTSAEAQANALTLRWLEAKTDQPIGKYRIYYGEQDVSFADCLLYGAAGADSRSDVIFYRSAGMKVAYIVAEDVAGNVGEPRRVDAKITMPNDFVLATEWYESWDIAELVNGIVIGGAAGQIVLPCDPNRTWAQRLAVGGWATAQQKSDAGYPVVVQPVPASGVHTERHDAGKVIASGVVRVQPFIASKQGSPVAQVRVRGSLGDTQTNWQPWVVGDGVTVVGARYFEVEYSVTSADGLSFVVLEDLYISIVTQELTRSASLAISAADVLGTAYVCDGFNDIKAVQATALGSASIAKINTIIDDAVNPPRVLVQAWDGSNSRVGGVVSIYVSGV